MNTILDVLRNKECFVSLKGATSDAIALAEQTLKVKFTAEYIAYISEFGAASYYGHELTGVCKSKSLDVVRITVSERDFTEVPADWYVVEQTHVDGIVIWQAGDGKIFQTSLKKKPRKLCDSLTEYINLE